MSFFFADSGLALISARTSDSVFAPLRSPLIRSCSLVFMMFCWAGEFDFGSCCGESSKAIQLQTNVFDERGWTDRVEGWYRDDEVVRWLFFLLYRAHQGVSFLLVFSAVLDRY